MARMNKLLWLYSLLAGLVLVCGVVQVLAGDWLGWLAIASPAPMWAGIFLTLKSIRWGGLFVSWAASTAVMWAMLSLFMRVLGWDPSFPLGPWAIVMVGTTIVFFLERPAEKLLGDTEEGAFDDGR